MAYHNWKRILAAVGTAALLVSNMGSVTHAVFAVEGQSEEVTDEEPEVEPEVEPQVEPETPEESVPEGSSEQGGSSQPEGEGNTNQNTNGDNNAGGEQGGNHNNIGGEQGGSNDDQNADGNNVGSNNDQKGDGGNGGSIGDNQGVTGGDNVTGGEGNPDGQPAGGETTPEPETPAITEGGSEDDKGDKENPAPQTYALSDSLKVTLETTESKKHDPAVDETDGAYLYDLGETASTTVTLTNPEDYTLDETDGAVVRVYMQFADAEPADDPDQESADTSAASDTENDEDAEGSDSKTDDASDDQKSVDPEDLHGKTRKPGKYTVEAERKDHQDTEDDQTSETEETTDDQHSEQEPNEYSYTVTQIEDGLYCYEIERPIDGDTISLELTSVYSKDSYGGENQIWVKALTLDEAAELDQVDMTELDDAEDENDEEESADSETIDDSGDVDPDDADADDQSEDQESSDEDAAESKTPETTDKGSRKISIQDRIDYYQSHRDKIHVAEAGDDEEIPILRWSREGVAGSQTADTEHYRVAVTYGADAGLPADAELQVTEYPTDSEEYQRICEEYGITFSWLLDVTFYVDGKEREPEAPISISVTALTDSVGISDTNRITHFAESGTEVLEGNAVENSNDSNGQPVVRFEVDSLSFLAGDNGEGDIALVDATTPSSNEGLSVTIPNEPTYSTSHTVSDAKSGETTSTKMSGGDITYGSDPSTSNIEDQFTRVKVQDGKVLTDKSVVYGANDYVNLGSYESDEFSVTLSALEQEFAEITEESVRTPLDVVFVLDTSASMDNNSRRSTMVSAVNNAIGEILNNHEANRVGVVTFSSGAWRLMGIDRYKAGNDNQYITVNGNYVVTATGLQTESGTRISTTPSNNGSPMHGGTYTQAGIAAAYEVFNEVRNNTTYTATLSPGHTTSDGKNTVTVIRKPVIVLLSDGEPTYCTTKYDSVISGTASGGNPSRHYSFSQTIYGSGGGGSNAATNNKGVLGYYTILSAVSYKEKIARIYYSDYSKGTDKDARFYTIGVGINPTGSGNSSGADNSISGDHYKRAVLNPTSYNVQNLNDLTYTYNRNNAWDNQTAKQLYKLLNKTYNDGAIDVMSRTNNDEYQSVMGGTSSRINSPLANHSFGKDYSYANNAWFDTNFTQNELENYFFSILMWNQGIQAYSPSIQQTTGVTLTDPIGEGMEVKGDLHLLYGSVDLTLVEDTARSTETSKVYKVANNQKSVQLSQAFPSNSGSDVDGKKSNQTVDLSTIVVRVTSETGSNGETLQTVSMVVPDDLMPSLYPELYGKFYYKESPIRLVYKVGLTDAAVAKVNKGMAGVDSTETFKFYTNRWSSDGSTTSTGAFSKSQANPYGFSNDQAASKSTNQTGTIGTSFSPSIDGNNVTQALGNNGVLTIKPRPRSLIVKKSWQDADGNVIGDTSQLPEVTGTLHRNRIRSSDAVNVSLVYSYQQYTGHFIVDYGAEWKTVTVGTYSVAENSNFAFYFGNIGNASLYYAPESNNTSVATASYGTSGGTRVVDVNVLSGDYVQISVGTDTIYSYGSSPPSPSVVFTQDYERPGSGQVEEDTTFSKNIVLNHGNNWTQYWSAEDLGEAAGYSYSYWVTENEVEGYVTSIDFGDSSHTLTPVDGNKTITITNQQKPSYELPSTGGSGTVPYEVGGSAAILASMFAGCSMWRRRRSERRCN